MKCSDLDLSVSRLRLINVVSKQLRRSLCCGWKRDEMGADWKVVPLEAHMFKLQLFSVECSL